MLLALSESLTCFKNNARLVGIMQQNQFDMVVENFEEIPVKCLAFNNTPSKAFLNYEESGVVKSIQTDFLYFADRPLDISFEKIPDAAFDLMATLSIITYTVKLEDKLDVMGTFTSIKNTLVNTSNCWGPMTLNYSRSGDSSLLNISAQPNDCLITDPAVSFQFLVNDVWESIQINPKTSPPAGYNGFKTPFVHMDTLFYEQAYSDMDAENQAKLFDFFAKYQANRLMEIRLSLQFKQAGSTLEQQIYSYIGILATESQECQSTINGFGGISLDWLQVIGDLTTLRTCITGATKVQSQAVFMNTKYEDERELATMAGMATIMFKLKKSGADLLKLESVPDAVVFMTFLDENHQVVREEVKYYTPELSCFFNIMTVVSYTETCIIFFPVLNSRCEKTYGPGVNTRFQQILQPTKSTSSRLVFQTYKFDVFYKEAQYFKQCLNNDQFSTDTTFTWYEGNFKQRQHAFIDKLKISFQPLAMINNDIDFQFKYDVGIDQVSIIAMTMSIVFVVILVAVAITFIIVIIKLNQ